MYREPKVTCEVCGAERNAMLHTRAESPPLAARKWLRKRCSRSRPKPCEFRYTAGLCFLRSSPAGQQERPDA